MMLWYLLRAFAQWSHQLQGGNKGREQRTLTPEDAELAAATCMSASLTDGEGKLQPPMDAQYIWVPEHARWV